MFFFRQKYFIGLTAGIDALKYKLFDISAFPNNRDRRIWIHWY
jgi:hypothetical protein